MKCVIRIKKKKMRRLVRVPIVVVFYAMAFAVIANAIIFMNELIVHGPCTVNKLSKLIQSIRQFGAQTNAAIQKMLYIFFFSFAVDILHVSSGQMNDLYMSLRLTAFSSNINTINNTTNWLYTKHRIRISSVYQVCWSNDVYIAWTIFKFTFTRWLGFSRSILAKCKCKFLHQISGLSVGFFFLHKVSYRFGLVWFWFYLCGKQMRTNKKK